jgi:hypothetical protein
MESLAGRNGPVRMTAQGPSRFDRETLLRVMSCPELTHDRYTEITTAHIQAFQMVTSPYVESITMIDCFINGEQGVAIVMMERE